MCSINEVFEMLNWNNSEEIQQKGIEEASKIKYISILFQPVENKGIWENCARVIAQKSDEVLSTYMIMLFEWLKDANWPGFFVIYNRIKKMKPDNIYPDYSYCIAMAKKQNDESWLDFMSGRGVSTVNNGKKIQYFYDHTGRRVRKDSRRGYYD